MKKLKIAILANIASIHTIRWANALSEKGNDVLLITQHRGANLLIERVKLNYLPFRGDKGYFLNVPFLRMILKKQQPHLLHVHYASGYGTLGSLSGFHPYILSVWGSDVYDFPYKSSLRMALIKRNLKVADLIVSTSHAMAKQTRQICEGVSKIHVTPFGIDINTFKPDKSRKNKDIITIGTVKTLSFIYGIDILIRGFAEARNALMKSDNCIASKLRLLIVGSGENRDSLKQLVESLNITCVTEFTGAVDHARVPDYLNKIDIYVAASRSESFGVSILEASACSLPVIVTSVGGLLEVVEDGITGIIIPKDDHHALAKAIEKLVINENLRRLMGQAGRQRVIDRYLWDDSVSIMEEVYKRAI
jgi:glycosyltransferase involved in cell wall biosynthesis